ncbi:hypothetical protein ACP70R_022765 [Stipagrostis hirtigluma subsp. patula]
MASGSHVVLLSAAVLLSALAAAAVAAPAYCAAGRVFPRLTSCRWYVNARTGCGASPYNESLEGLKGACCQELAAVSPECRCRALRDMVDYTMATAKEPDSGCWRRQAEFGAAVVTELECGLPTIHGGPFCYPLGAEY